MRFPHRAFLAALVVVAGCGGRGDTPEIAAPESVPVTGTCDDPALAAALGEWGGAGFTGAVVVDGPDASCRVGVGSTGRDGGEPISADTVFAIGSVSKAVVAAAVLQLEASGALELDEPAGRFVDGLSGPAAEATIESLLLHTSGLTGSHGEDHTPLDRDDAVRAISALTVDESSVGSFLYSNAGYTLLALVIEGASGVEYRRFLLDHVLPEGAGFWDGEPAATGPRAVGVRDGEPTGVDGTFPGPHWALQGNGDVAMSAASLAGWTREVFTGSLLPASAIERMTEPALDDEGQSITIGWGRLAQDVLGEVALGAAGGGGDVGHEVVTLWLPESQRVVVIATSTDRVTAEDFVQLIGPALIAGAELPRPDEPVAVGEEVLDAAAGAYALPNGDRFDVERVDDALVVTPTGGVALEALLPTTTPPDEVAEHESAVASLLAGETRAGEDEVAILEADHGPLLDIDVLGSTDDGELRTYVELAFTETAVVGWYALDAAGGIEGVDLGGLPSVRLVPTADGFRVEHRSAGDQAVTVSFDDEQMVIRTPEGAVVAERV